MPLMSLIVVAGVPWRIILSSEEVGDEIFVEGVRFVDTGNGVCIGFYDWLRSPDRRILGVRAWLDIADYGEAFRQFAKNPPFEIRVTRS